MQMKIPYGSNTITFEIPEENFMFEGTLMDTRGQTHLAEAVRKSLDKPFGCLPLSACVKPTDRVLILIEDATRSTPVREILPVLVDYLLECSLALDQMEILTAPGSHRLMTEAEILEKVGPELINKIKIHQHDYQDESSMVTMPSVFVKGYEIPVQVNNKVLDADFIIGIGNIIPHSDAGFSGGAKILQPGICGYPTTAATHISAAMLEEIPLGVVDNPCRLGIEQVARQAGLKFIINTVKNHRDEVIEVVSGDFVEAHREGARISRQAFSVEMPALADIVIVSSFPADLDFWQALKGVTSAYFAVKPGGAIVFASPCYEGLAHNHPKFSDWLSMSYHDILEKTKAAPIDDKSIDLISAVLAVCNSRAREKAQILVISHGLDDEAVEVLGYKRAESVQAAVDQLLTLNPEATIAVLPRGGDCLPVLKAGDEGITL
jgi:nickel-dependent lactate racemase